MALGDDLERIAGAAAAHGEVTGVLAAEPARGRRLYLVALGADEARRWLVLDDGRPADRARATTCATWRRSSRCASWRPSSPAAATSSSCASQLAQVRMVEQPPGIEEAEAAALALERVVGAPPRVASPALSRRGRRRDARARAGARRAGVAVLERDPRRRPGAVERVRRGRRARLPRPTFANVGGMEGGFGGFPFGGDPEDLLRGLREFAEQQAESVQEAQREQFATLTLNTAVELTAAALSQVQLARDGRRAGGRDARRHARALPRGGRARQRRPPGLHARAPALRARSPAAYGGCTVVVRRVGRRRRRWRVVVRVARREGERRLHPARCVAGNGAPERRSCPSCRLTSSTARLARLDQRACASMTPPPLIASACAYLPAFRIDEAHGAVLRRLATDSLILNSRSVTRDRRLGGRRVRATTPGGGGAEHAESEDGSEEECAGESHTGTYAPVADRFALRSRAARGSPRPTRSSASCRPSRGRSCSGCPRATSRARRSTTRCASSQAERQREARDGRRARRGDHEPGRGARDRRPVPRRARADRRARGSTRTSR